MGLFGCSNTGAAVRLASHTDRSVEDAEVGHRPTLFRGTYFRNLIKIWSTCFGLSQGVSQGGPAPGRRFLLGDGAMTIRTNNIALCYFIRARRVVASAGADKKHPH